MRAFKARVAEASAHGVEEFRAAFGFADVIAWASAADANDSACLVADQSGGGGLAAIDAQKQLHGFTTL
jgi:hypothetical protein